MFDSLDLVLDYVGGSLLAAGLVVAGVWVGRKLFERGLDSAIQQGIDAHRNELAKELEDHKSDIAKQLAAQHREHEAKLEVVRSELRSVEREAEQLRAHSLGLEAERRRNFEAKRADVCAEMFASATEVVGTMLRTYPDVLSVAEGPEKGRAHPQYVVARKGVMKAKSTLEELFVANQAASLFISETSYKRAGFLRSGLDMANLKMLTALADMPYEGWDTGPTGKALESLRESLRQDLLAPVPAPWPAESTADGPATEPPTRQPGPSGADATSPESQQPMSGASGDLEEGTPPDPELPQSPSDSNPGGGAVEPG